MIDEDSIQLIKRLTRQGLTEAEIVRQTGKSRNAVRRYMKIARRIVTPKDLLRRLIQYPINANTVYSICPCCQKRVSIPCRACLTKMYNLLCKKQVITEIGDVDAFSMLNALSPDKKAPLCTLNLRLKEYKRYLEVRAKKLQQLENNE